MAIAAPRPLHKLVKKSAFNAVSQAAVRLAKGGLSL
jgi:hypothetical protein